MMALTSGIPKRGQDIQPAQAHLQTSNFVSGFATGKNKTEGREDNRSGGAAKLLRMAAWPGAHAWWSDAARPP